MKNSKNKPTSKSHNMGVLKDLRLLGSQNKPTFWHISPNKPSLNRGLFGLFSHIICRKSFRISMLGKLTFGLKLYIETHSKPPLSLGERGLVYGLFGLLLT
jgi:hypothetical protein